MKSLSLLPNINGSPFNEDRTYLLRNNVVKLKKYQSIKKIAKFKWFIIFHLILSLILKLFTRANLQNP